MAAASHHSPSTPGIEFKRLTRSRGTSPKVWLDKWPAQVVVSAPYAHVAPNCRRRRRSPRLVLSCPRLVLFLVVERSRLCLEILLLLVRSRLWAWVVIVFVRKEGAYALLLDCVVFHLSLSFCAGSFGQPCSEGRIHPTNQTNLRFREEE